MIFRDSDGEWNATSAHEAGPIQPLCSSCISPRRCHKGALLCPFDDGNGLWISQRETPSDQGITRKYYPQDYDHL
jgi:hypothetical protein